jgi:uncharacterized membrane protein
MSWLLYTLLSGLFIGFASFFRKMASKTSGSLGGFIIEGLVYGCITVLFFLFQQNKATLVSHPLYSTLSALALFGGAFFLYKAFSTGTLSLTNIIYLSVSLTVVVIISLVVLREPLSIKQIMGMVLGIIAIFLIKS